ncbi:DUF805 domain-containing protein [Neogemmobacter tilapiae]|nr:DUF805 domain-containing protein [Gemmobacter tilapiae]
MNAIDAIRTGFAKSFQFSGRAGRAEFWWFYCLCSILIRAISAYTQHEIWQSPRLLVAIYLTFAWVAAGVRRIHDIGRSAHLFAVGAVASVLLAPMALNLSRDNPIDASAAQWLCFVLMWAITFYLYWYLISPSQPGPNKYGPNPHEVPS